MKSVIAVLIMMQGQADPVSYMEVESVEICLDYVESIEDELSYVETDHQLYAKCKVRHYDERIESVFSAVEHKP